MSKKTSHDLEAQQEKLWRSAARCIPRWGKLKEDDYNFRSWADDEKLLDVGWAYEYARESHKFRCWLWLDQNREQRSATGILIRFKGKRTRNLALSQSGLETWLRVFTDDLIANRSFAELLGTNVAKVQESINALPTYCRFPKAVERPGRHINYPGSQIVEIQIFWRRYTNKEIGEQMARLAGELRPDSEKGPQRKGKGKVSGTTHLLDALSAMRLASWFPVSPPRHRAGLLSVRDALTAIDHFNDIRLGGRAPVDEGNFYSYIREARQLVEDLFFGYQADNAKSCAEKQTVRK